MRLLASRSDLAEHGLNADRLLVASYEVSVRAALGFAGVTKPKSKPSKQMARAQLRSGQPQLNPGLEQHEQDLRHNLEDNRWLRLVRRSAAAQSAEEWLLLEIISNSRRLYQALAGSGSSTGVRAFAILNAALSRQSLLCPGQELTVH